MKSSSGTVLWEGIVRAAADKLALGCGGIAATAGLVVDSWWLVALSGAGYAASIAWRLSRVSFWKDLLRDRHLRPPALPERDMMADPSAQRFLQRLIATRLERAQVVKRNREALPAGLLLRMESLPEIERQAVMLLERLEDLSSYLCDKDLRYFQGTAERLRKCGEVAHDARIREEYTRAHHVHHERLGTLEQIATERDLLCARLETLIGTLEAFPMLVVRCSAHDLPPAELDSSWFEPPLALFGHHAEATTPGATLVDRETPPS